MRFAKFCLRAGHGLADVAALGLEILQRHKAAGMPAGLRLLDEGLVECVLAFEHQLVERAALLLGRSVLVGRALGVQVTFPPVVGGRAQEALEVCRSEGRIAVVVLGRHSEDDAGRVRLEGRRCLGRF
jgi:hypothetical protein